MKNSAAQNELKKLPRTALLELFLAQSEELDREKSALAALETQLAEQKNRVARSNTVAAAVMDLSGVSKAAQKAVDVYLKNISGRSKKQPVEN